MNPAPYPGTIPVTPVPNPGTNPTTPIGLPTPDPIALPTPDPTQPPNDSNAFWSPWPLPPLGNQTAALGVGFGSAGSNGGVIPLSFRPSGVYGLDAELSANDIRQQHYVGYVGYRSATADDDLRYRGGKLIRNLSYVNLYVSGDTKWSAADVEQIDGSLSAAMRDEHLNNVLLQYYNNQPITSTALPSHPLVGYTPATVTRGDIQNYINHLHQQGFLQSFDLDNTVFNFLLPPGTILAGLNSAASGQGSTSNAQTFGTRAQGQDSAETDSVAGLGGYHGSVVTANGGKVYFAVSVYSQRFANGSTNGIPVFSEPWKNVVATLYHQLSEARTDPNVEDAIRDSSDLNADRNLGWVSDSGLEIGDLPLRANVPITSVVREVPLADGSGTVPVQLMYSNFVHDFEGPIPQPHPLP